MSMRGTRWLGVAVLVSLYGCHTLMDHCYDKTTAIRDRFAAQRAWEQMQSIYANIYCYDDFRRGFLDGYVTVAGGGSGHPPTVPPKRYWSAHYEDAVGQRQQIAWYDGFEHGVAAAELEGVATYRTLVSPTHRRAEGPLWHVAPVHSPLPSVGPRPVEQPVVPPPPPTPARAPSPGLQTTSVETPFFLTPEPEDHEDWDGGGDIAYGVDVPRDWMPRKRTIE